MIDNTLVSKMKQKRRKYGCTYDKTSCRFVCTMLYTWLVSARTNNHHLSHFIEVILLEQQQNNGEEEEENFDVSDQVGNIMKDETIKQ